jgi:hypothetical protein
MIKGVRPGLCSGLARKLCAEISKFASSDLRNIEAQVLEKITGEMNKKFDRESENLKAVINNYIASSGIIIKNSEPVNFLKDVVLNDGGNTSYDNPAYLRPYRITINPNGLFTVPVDVHEILPKEDIENYTQAYLRKHQFGECYTFFDLNRGFTYTQILSMLPVIDKLWVGEKPPIKLNELKGFGWKDNNKYNELLEKELVKCTILGLTPGLQINHSHNLNGFIVNFHIGEKS